MDIITKTARDAARLLNAIRAQYIIVLPTGEQIIQGDLKLLFKCGHGLSFLANDNASCHTSQAFSIDPKM